MGEGKKAGLGRRPFEHILMHIDLDAEMPQVGSLKRGKPLANIMLLRVSEEAQDHQDMMS